MLNNLLEVGYMFLVVEIVLFDCFYRNMLVLFDIFKF